MSAKNVLTFGAWILQGLLLGAAAAADSPTVVERYGEADQVSLVRVNRIGNLVNPALTSRGMLAVQSALYSVKVLREWKGNGQSSVAIRVDYSDCAQTLRKGQDYLVFSRRNEQQQLQAYRCEDLIVAETAAELVAKLDRLVHLAVAKE